MKKPDLLLTDKEAVLGCGVGQGARCCKYLLAGEHGFFCGRVTELAATLIVAKYTAQRLPDEPYPDCQLKAN